MARESRGVGLMWKITGSFVGMIMLLGFLVGGIVYKFAGHELRRHVDLRASAISTNLSDAAAGHVVVRDPLQLDALVTKYSGLEGAAYAFIEDGKGKIVAHSFGTFPPEIREPLSSDDRRETHGRKLKFQGKAVYETRSPILEGQVGAAHVGFWDDAMEREIRQALLPLIGLIAIVLFAGVVLSALLARSIVRPILRLTQIADKITMGDLDTPVDIKSRDEIGGLACSLERMRSSLNAAMSRLNRESV